MTLLSCSPSVVRGRRGNVDSDFLPFLGDCRCLLEVWVSVAVTCSLFRPLTQMSVCVFRKCQSHCQTCGAVQFLLGNIFRGRRRAS